MGLRADKTAHRNECAGGSFRRYPTADANCRPDRPIGRSPDSRSVRPDSRLPTPVPTANCRLPTAAVIVRRHPTAVCRLPSRLPTADCRLPSTDCRRRPSSSPDCQLPTAVPSAVCRLPTAEVVVRRHPVPGTRNPIPFSQIARSVLGQKTASGNPPPSCASGVFPRHPCSRWRSGPWD